MIINIDIHSPVRGNSKKSILGIIVFCQFIAAVSSLGMPPFFALILEKNFGKQASLWAGIFYVIPSFFSALVSPIWGKLSDLYGKKLLLIRAQLGLSVSFLIAGYSHTPVQFGFALLIQGIFGGTFAASKAYICSVVDQAQLPKSLTWMEAAPRSALVISPFLMGTMFHLSSPIEVYKYLALLPLGSIALSLTLPETASIQKKGITSVKSQTSTFQLDSTYITLLLIQFIFTFTSVLITPYLSIVLKTNFADLNPGQIGLLIGLPHMVYLLWIFCPKTKGSVISEAYSTPAIYISLVMQAISYLGQLYSERLGGFILWRIGNGISMTLFLISFHYLISQSTQLINSGLFFGWLESSFRFGNVAAGLVASLSYTWLGPGFSFFISASLLSAAPIVLYWQKTAHYLKPLEGEVKQ